LSGVYGTPEVTVFVHHAPDSGEVGLQREIVVAGAQDTVEAGVLVAGVGERSGEGEVCGDVGSEREFGAAGDARALGRHGEHEEGLAEGVGDVGERQLRVLCGDGVVGVALLIELEGEAGAGVIGERDAGGELAAADGLERLDVVEAEQVERRGKLLVVGKAEVR
jgi:hypothetical protein